MNLRGLAGTTTRGASYLRVPVGSRGQNLLFALALIYVLAWYFRLI